MPKQLTKYDFNVDKKNSKSDSPYMWDKGCSHCRKCFSEEETFVVVDECGWEGVWAFHKGNCFASGFHLLLQGKTLGYDYGVKT